MLNRILDQGKKYASEILNNYSIAIDATAGNGHDTLFLLDHISKGKVYAFDVQQDAIKNTTKRVRTHKNFAILSLIHDGHENVLNYVTEPIDVALFNLGYLPSGDKTITTQSETTKTAISKIANQLNIGGRIIITIYHGHESGKEERDNVLELVTLFDQKQYNVLKYQFINQKNNAPFLVVIEKKK